MKTDELNHYIKHYIEKDKTKSAIMLTANWGTGKSHYINNKLIPFLLKEENGGHECIVISLYGIRDIDSISKTIYLESRAKFLKSKSELATTGKLLATTVAKNITGILGINLDFTEEQLNKLYQSIDLTKKLLIFEDIERTEIDIIKFLGYINNLVELDNVKVLLVANEKEILRKHNVQKNDIKEERNYLEIKEKSISDTLLFEGDHTSAISQIIQSFDSTLLQKFNDTNSINDILELMNSCGNYNLRSFIYACQKTNDIFEKLQDEDDLEFIRCIFYGIIIFSLNFKAGNNLIWKGENDFSVDLGNEKYPLFRFCFDYITIQCFDHEEVSNAKSAFSNLRLYDQHKSIHDPDLDTLYYFDLHYESEVVAAVNSITNRLKNPADISFYEYGTIAAKLILVKHLIGCDISEAKKYLITNLENIKENLGREMIFRISFQNYTHQIQDEYNQLKHDMIIALETDKTVIKDFNYLPQQASIFYDNVCKNIAVFHSNRSFAKSLDQNRLIEMFFQSNPEQMYDIRGAFLAVYRSNSVYSFMEEDIPFINLILQLLKSKLTVYKLDKVQMLQYNYFIENLEEIINRFNSSHL